MNSGAPASVALPDRASFGMMMSASADHGCVLVRGEELRLERLLLAAAFCRAAAACSATALASASFQVSAAAAGAVPGFATSRVA